MELDILLIKEKRITRIIPLRECCITPCLYRNPEILCVRDLPFAVLLASLVRIIIYILLLLYVYVWLTIIVKLYYHITMFTRCHEYLNCNWTLTSRLLFPYFTPNYFHNIMKGLFDAELFIWLFVEFQFGRWNVRFIDSSYAIYVQWVL